MSTPETVDRSSDRLLTFEVGGSAYALPIGQVLEVAEAGRITCIPTISRRVGGVMNWHGEAIPVLSPDLLLDETADPSEEMADPSGETPAPSSLEAVEHLLVVSDRASTSPSLGLPVDQVLGLVDGAASGTRGTALVVERRSIDGRVVSVLDPARLVARAGEVIERAIA